MLEFLSPIPTGKIVKTVMNYTALFSLLVSSGCMKVNPNLEEIKPYKCPPAETNNDFRAYIQVHSSAKDLLTDVDAYCNLVNSLAQIVGAKSTNNISVISPSITLDEFKDLRYKELGFPGLTKAEYWFNLIKNQKILGEFEKPDYTNKIFIVADEKTTTSFENRALDLIIGTAGELHHSGMIGLLTQCSALDIAGVQASFSIGEGLKDYLNNTFNTDISSKTVSLTCPSGTVLFNYDENYYRQGYAHPELLEFAKASLK